MEKLAYIVSSKKIRGIKRFIGVVDDISLTEPDKPVMVIGYELAKKYFGDDISVLNRRISDKVCWTFLKTEKRIDYEDDLEKLYKNVIDYHITNLKYVYVNILLFNINKTKRIINLFKNKKVKYIYINDKMLYFLHSDEKSKGKMIIGISIQILKYCGIGIDKIINKINDVGDVVICDNASECVKNIRDEIIGKEYSIPYFMSLI
jgi:hypothetical protein